MIKQLAHVCLNVQDLSRTRAFYEGVLGLTVKFTFEKAGRLVGMYFDLGGDTFIEVFEKEDAAAVNKGITHFCLETDDLDALMKRLERHGIAHTEKKMGADHTYQFWFKDPDGNDIEVQQYTDKSMQRRRGVVAVDW